METEQRFPPDTSGVFDILSFVEYHVLPFDPLEVLLILGDLYSHRRASLPTSALRTYQLIARDNDMKRGVLIVTDLLSAPELSESFAIIGITPVR